MSLCFCPGRICTRHGRTRLRLLQRDCISHLCQCSSSLISHSHATRVRRDLHFHCNSGALESSPKTSRSLHPICVQIDGSSFVDEWGLLLHSFISSLVCGLQEECGNSFLLRYLRKEYDVCFIIGLEIFGLLLGLFLALRFYVIPPSAWCCSLEWHCSCSFLSELFVYKGLEILLLNHLVHALPQLISLLHAKISMQ